MKNQNSKHSERKKEVLREIIRNSQTLLAQSAILAALDIKEPIDYRALRLVAEFAASHAFLKLKSIQSDEDASARADKNLLTE